MAVEPVLVDGEIFISRVEEQSRFRQALQAVLNSGRSGGPTHIFLIQGERGVGKSKLLRRLRDIAALEIPYDTEVQTILADWELEYQRANALKVPGESLHGRTIFYHLYRMARDAGWGHNFTEYQSGLRFLNEVEGKISDRLEMAVWDDNYGALRFLEINGIAGLLRGRVSPNDKGLRIMPNFLADILKEGPECVEIARSQVEDWLQRQSGLKPEEEAIFRRPSESLAEAIGIGFGKASQLKPIVLLMDSFEIISGMNAWLWTIMKSTGHRVIWVIAGEGDLANALESQVAQSTGTNLKLNVLNLRNFNDKQVSEYIVFRAPDRMLVHEDLQAIYRTTGGFPLAVQQAADMWAGGVPLSDITDVKLTDSSRQAILALISQRLLAHSDDPRDRRAFLMMAIQRRPEETVQTAVLRPEKGSFDLEQYLEELKIRYFSVRTNGLANLHDFTSESIRAYLLRHRIRVSDEVKVITSRAISALKRLRDEIESGIPRLEDRFESDEWREIMLDHIHWLFWHNEFNGWRQFNRDFVDALGYDRGIAVRLGNVLAAVKPILGRDGVTRARIVERGLFLRETHLNDGVLQGSLRDYDAEVVLLEELDRWHTRYGSKDNYATERRAILDLRLGELFFCRGKFPEALNHYLQVEKNLPGRGEALRLQLGQAFEELGEKQAWQRSGLKIVEPNPSEDAERALKKAVSYGRRKAMVYHSLGAVQVKLGKSDPALENLLQAVTLNPANKNGWQTLGEVYFENQQFDKAVPAFRRAGELDPKMISAQLFLAYCYRELDRKKEFQEHTSKLGKLVEGESEYIHACYQAIMGNIPHALGYLKIAIREGQVSKDIIRQSPLLASLRSDPGFQNLIV